MKPKKIQRKGWNDEPLCLVPVSAENSTVDGHDWLAEGLGERFVALDFIGKLFIDPGYKEGCIKYVPCGMDDDPTCGHRVRSKFDEATPVLKNGKWYWETCEFYGKVEVESQSP